MTDDRMSHNQVSGLWRYEFRDDADTVAYADSKLLLEQLLDWAENNVRLYGPNRSEPPAV